MVLINQVKSSIKYGVYHQKLLFKTKGPYRVLYKAKPGSLCLQNLHFLGGLGKPGRNAKESAAKMKKISYTVVLHNHVDG